MQFTTLFFDVDDTLYPSSVGLWEAIRHRMNAYLVERMGFSPQEVEQLRERYFTTYGTTLRGLMIHQPERIDVDQYLAYVHDLPLADYLQPNPALRHLLLTLPQRRWLFTNADGAHARRVTQALGIADCFEGIVDIRSLGFSCKPVASAYAMALAQVGEADPRRCVLLDDSPRNLAPAHEMGFFTVRVGSGSPHPAAALSITRLEDLPFAMPELWQDS